MALIAIRTSTALRHKRIALLRPGAAVPDGDGGFTQGFVPLDPPSMFGYVRPATVRDLESLAAGTVATHATHLVSLPFHPGVTTDCELRVEQPPGADRRFAIGAVLNPDERSSDLLLLCTELTAEGGA